MIVCANAVKPTSRSVVNVGLRLRRGRCRHWQAQAFKIFASTLIAFGGCALILVDSFVLWGAPALFIHAAKIVHGPRVALISTFGKPLEGFIQIAFSAPAIKQHAGI